MSISKNQSGTGSRLGSPRKIEETLIFPERLMNWPWSTFFVAQERKKNKTQALCFLSFSVSPELEQEEPKKNLQTINALPKITDWRIFSNLGQTH